MTEYVLVTGGSGLIAGHCILQLLEQGYRVRTTVRSLGKEAQVRQVLTDAGMTHGEALDFVAADLTSDAGWPEAVAGIDYVLHVASPVAPGQVKNEDEVIVPAREGALRVLRAATGTGVRRVVLTSAFHAVSWGHPHHGREFTEDDWTILDGPGVDAYGKSKTLSERAAWEYVASHADAPELVTMLPVAVMGPVMGADISGSNHLIQALLKGEMPGIPDVYPPIVDVRDVAAGHLLAMTTPAAAGERFILSAGNAIAMRRVAEVLRQSLGPAASKVPTRNLPSLLIRVMALFNADARAAVPDLGYAKKVSNRKAREVLGWQPRNPEEAIIAAGKSMAALPPGQ